MARSEITAQSVAATGLELTTEAANVDGNAFVNDGNTILYVDNASGGDITVTVQTPATQDGLDVAEQAVVVTAGEARYIGRMVPRTYNRPQGGTDPGQVYVDYSGVTSLTVAVIEP